jgi:hypothetical protein
MHVSPDAANVVPDAVELWVAVRSADRRLPSYAGHNANHLATIAPTSKLFVPSKAGRSHFPGGVAGSARSGERSQSASGGTRAVH